MLRYIHKIVVAFLFCTGSLHVLEPDQARQPPRHWKRARLSLGLVKTNGLHRHGRRYTCHMRRATENDFNRHSSPFSPPLGGLGLMEENIGIAVFPPSRFITIPKPLLDSNNLLGSTAFRLRRASGTLSKGNGSYQRMWGKARPGDAVTVKIIQRQRRGVCRGNWGAR